MKRIELEEIFSEKEKKGFSFENREIRKLLSINIRKQAIDFYNFAESKFKNSDKMIFPTFDFNLNIDTLIVAKMKDLEFSHKLILRVIDEMLVPNANAISEGYDFLTAWAVLAYIKGYGAISDSEMNERQIFIKNKCELKRKDEYSNNRAIGIIINNNKILIEKRPSNVLGINSENENIFWVSGKDEKTLKSKLIEAIMQKTDKKIKNINFWIRKNIDRFNTKFTCDFYIIELENANLKTDNLIWYDLNTIMNKTTLIDTEYVLFKGCIQETSVYNPVNEAQDLLYVIDSEKALNQMISGQNELKCYAYGIVIYDDVCNFLLEKNVDKNKSGFVQTGNGRKIEVLDSKITFYDLFTVAGESNDVLKNKLIEKVAKETGKDIEIVYFNGQVIDYNYNLIEYYILKIKDGDITNKNLKWYNLNAKPEVTIGPALKSFMDAISESNS